MSERKPWTEKVIDIPNLGGPNLKITKIDTENSKMESNFTHYEIIVLNIWQKWKTMQITVVNVITQVSQPFRFKNFQAKMVER